MAFFDAKEECLDRDELARLQRNKLRSLWNSIVRATDRRSEASFYQRKFAGISFDPLRDPPAALPFTTKIEIQADQQRFQPYGSNLTLDLSRYTRFHQTSGTTGTPVRWLDTPESWEWVKSVGPSFTEGPGCGSWIG